MNQISKKIFYSLNALPALFLAVKDVSAANRVAVASVRCAATGSTNNNMIFFTIDSGGKVTVRNSCGNSTTQSLTSSYFCANTGSL